MKRILLLLVTVLIAANIFGKPVRYDAKVWRAVQTYDLHYADLKQMVRTSLEHSFLRGASLWSAPDAFTRVVSVCAQDLLGAEKYSSRCADFLGSNEKASEQWELERRFRAFEAEM